MLSVNSIKSGLSRYLSKDHQDAIVRTIGRGAFADGCELSEAEFGEELSALEEDAFMN